MSDQHPPSSGPAPDDEPTPEVEPTADAEHAPAEEPEPQPRRRRTLVTVVAGILVLALVAGGLGAFFLLRTDSHKLVTPATAGEMKRDQTKEKTLADPISQAEELIRSQSKGGGKTSVSYVRSAVYNQDDSKRGPEGALVFLGAKLKTKQVPADWVRDRFGKLAKQNGLKVSNVSAGDGGGKAVCASVASPQKIAICAWATEDTIGEVVPTVPGYDVESLATIMRDLRADVEQSE